MNALALHEFHHGLSARFTEVNGLEVVESYGDVAPEYSALTETTGVLDLSYRGRICLTGTDRLRFLNGQVTNNVKDLKPGTGCYAALVNARGKMQCDLNIFRLQDELLLDFEPGLTDLIKQRLEKYIIADDVQLVDVSLDYGLLTVQGPSAEAAVKELALPIEVAAQPFHFASVNDATLGELHLMNQPRLGTKGFDLFVPAPALGAVMEKLLAATRKNGGRPCGWTAMETARIEAGVPRFGADMDESNLVPEAGIESRAISYSKGCYIGQEVIARIRTYGQVAKSLRGLRFDESCPSLPNHGDKLFHEGKEVGNVTSSTLSPLLKTAIALGYVRKEANAAGTELTCKGALGECHARVVDLPFQR